MGACFACVKEPHGRQGVWPMAPLTLIAAGARADYWCDNEIPIATPGSVLSTEAPTEGGSLGAKHFSGGRQLNINEFASTRMYTRWSLSVSIGRMADPS